jgi:hypothetical protein
MGLQKEKMSVTAKPGVEGGPSSRAKRSDPGDRRAPCDPLDRHAAARLAMTERPLSSEASDRAPLGGYKCRGGRRKSLKRLDSAKETARFSLVSFRKSLDFVPETFGFASGKTWVSFNALAPEF